MIDCRVLQPPIISHPHKLANIFANQGEDVRVACNADGDPRLEPGGGCQGSLQRRWGPEVRTRVWTTGYHATQTGTQGENEGNDVRIACNTDRDPRFEPGGGRQGRMQCRRGPKGRTRRRASG